MEFVFIHGWGFDARFWDALAALLPDYPQHRVDRGFFGSSTKEIKSSKPLILIGHSLGFVHGMRERQDWAGWVAINSFPRFVSNASGAGCVAPPVLRDMRQRLNADPEETLRRFYTLIGAALPVRSLAEANVARLSEGLDELRDVDVSENLSSAAVPGLVLASRNDPLVPVAVSEDLVAKSRVHILWHETGGHILPQTDPAWCANAIKAWCSK